MSKGAMGRALSVVLLLATAGCGSVGAGHDGGGPAGHGGGNAGGGGGAGGGIAGADGGVAGADGGVADAAADRASNASDAQSDSAPAGDAAAEAGAPLASCNEIKTSTPGAPSGVYSIAPITGAAAYSVYCNMDLDGGGWTVFFAGKNDAANVFSHFEDTNVACTDPQMHCLRRLPATLTNAVDIAATCGGASVKFKLNAAAFNYFQNGVTAQWQLLSNISQITAGNTSYAGAVWTGDGATNKGWIISSASEGNGTTQAMTFSSSYNVNTSWNYCNGVANTGATITLMYR